MKKRLAKKILQRQSTLLWRPASLRAALIRLWGDPVRAGDPYWAEYGGHYRGAARTPAWTTRRGGGA